MTLLTTLHTKRNELQAIGQKYGVSNIRVFGSVARGEEREDSDIDLLIHFDKEHYTGFALGGFQYHSSQLLGRRVDIVMDDNIAPALKPYILSEVRQVTS